MYNWVSFYSNYWHLISLSLAVELASVLSCVCSSVRQPSCPFKVLFLLYCRGGVSDKMLQMLTVGCLDMTLQFNDKLYLVLLFSFLETVLIWTS